MRKKKKKRKMFEPSVCHPPARLQRPNESPREYEWLYAFSLTFLFSMSLTWFVYMAYRGRSSPQALISGAKRDEMAYLVGFVNPSVGPCHDFYGYACSVWNKEHWKSRYDVSLRKTLVIPTLQGKFRSRTTGYLRDYYTSCLSSNRRETSVLSERALAAVLSVTSPKMPPSAKDTLRVIMTLCLEYGVAAVFNATVTRGQIGGLHFSVVSFAPAASLQDEEFDGVSDLLVAAMNEKLDMPVANAAVHAFRAELRNWTAPNSNVTGDVSQLDVLVPDVHVSSWRDILRTSRLLSNQTTVHIFSSGNVRRLFRIFTDVSRQPTALSYLLLEAAARLIGVFAPVVTWFNTEKLIQSCFVDVFGLKLLWRVAFAEALASKKADDAIVFVYAKIRDIVKREAPALLAKRYARALGDLTIRGFNISTVVTYSINLPLMTDNHFTNKLLLQRLVIHHWLERATDANGLHPLIREWAMHSHVTEHGNLVVVPAALYTMLHFANLSRRVTAAATVGVGVADILWSSILRDRGFAPLASSSLNESQECLSDVSVSSGDDVVLKYPFLSSHTAARLLMNEIWHEMIYPWSRWSMTMGQAFFTIFARHYVCSSVTDGLLNETEARFMLDNVASCSDFSAAFNCRSSAP